MGQTFIIHLSKVLETAQKPQKDGGMGLTIYRIAKDTGVSFNFVKKFAAGDVKTPYVTSEVVQLCKYFKLDWRNPEIVELMENKEDDSSGQIKTPLAALA